jgi:predicted DNA-binding transcriptional regulator AlpA
MLNTTLEIVRSGLKADPTLTPQERARLLATFRARGTQRFNPPVATEPRLIRRGEAARRLSCSLRTVDKLASTGILPKRKLPGRIRASGFLASDLESLLMGGRDGAQ